MTLTPVVLQSAVLNGGLVKRSELLEMGFSTASVDRLVSSGQLMAVKAGLYRVLELKRHEDLLRGAILGLPRAVVSHESAAHLLRFPRLPRLRPTVTVHAKTTHVFPGVLVRRNTDLLPDHTLRLDGMRVTNVTRTVFDLAGVITETDLDGIVEALIVGDRLNISALAELGKTLRRRGKPGSAAVARIIARRGSGGDQARTKLETLGSRILHDSGLPEPAIEYPAPWNPHERIDAAYPEARLGIEWDSKAWHLSDRALRNDRRRDREAAIHGWVILRFTWSDLVERPNEVAAQIELLLTSRSS